MLLELLQICLKTFPKNILNANERFLSIEGGNKKCKYVSTNVMVSKLAKIVLKSKQLKADVYRMGITERKK
jgi:hypothetical protein